MIRRLFSPAPAPPTAVNLPGSIKSEVPVSGEALDRRAFLFGMTLTSAGLLVPRAPQVFVPPLPQLWQVQFHLGFDLGVATFRLSSGLMIEEKVHIDERENLLKQMGCPGFTYVDRSWVHGDGQMTSITNLSESAAEEYRRIFREGL